MACTYCTYTCIHACKNCVCVHVSVVCVFRKIYNAVCLPFLPVLQMNLALTYASRTQHVRLARHISELIQQKSMEELSDDDDDPIGQFDDNWTNQDADDDTTDDVMYAKSRSHTLNKRSDLVSKMSSKKINLSSKFGKMTSSADGRSKFNRYMDQVKRGKFLSSASSSSWKLKALKGDQDGLDEEEREEDGNSPVANEGAVSSTGTGDVIGGVEGGVGGGGGYDETKELFSDSEQDPVGDGDMEVEGERGGGGGESDDGLDDDFSFTPTGDGGGFSASSGKRANPFKVSINCISYITMLCTCKIYMYF